MTEYAFISIDGLDGRHCQDPPHGKPTSQFHHGNALALRVCLRVCVGVMCVCLLCQFI